MRAPVSNAEGVLPFMVQHWKLQSITSSYSWLKTIAGYQIHGKRNSIILVDGGVAESYCGKTGGTGVIEGAFGGSTVDHKQSSSPQS